MSNTRMYLLKINSKQPPLLFVRSTDYGGLSFELHTPYKTFAILFRLWKFPIVYVR